MGRRDGIQTSESFTRGDAKHDSHALDYSGACAEMTSRTVSMLFSKRLHAGILRGDITCSVRIWKRPHVKVGGRYKFGAGEIEIDSIDRIGIEDVTPALARSSGFEGVIDLLKIAKHGSGENVYLIKFHYIRPRAKRRNAGA
jgi:hypothetical protein